MTDIVERLSDVGLWGEAKAEIKRLRAERNALLSVLSEVSATGGLANESVWDRVDAAIDTARKGER